MAIGGTLLLATAGFKALGLALSFTAIGGAGKIAGIAGDLTSVGGGLKTIAGAAGAFIAAYAGWKAGEWANDNIINPLVARATGKKGDTLGSAVYSLFNKEWNPNDPTSTMSSPAKPTSVAGIAIGVPAQPLKGSPFNSVQPRATAPQFNTPSPFTSVIPGNSPFIAPKSSQPIQVNSVVNLDGRKIGESVTKHQAREATRPFATASGFDGGMTMAPVGLNYSR